MVQILVSLSFEPPQQTFLFIDYLIGADLEPCECSSFEGRRQLPFGTTLPPKNPRPLAVRRELFRKFDKLVPVPYSFGLVRISHAKPLHFLASQGEIIKKRNSLGIADNFILKTLSLNQEILKQLNA